MKWNLSGTYLSVCTCKSDTHWPIGGTMSDSNGPCNGCAIFTVDGTFHDIDLNGIQFAIYNMFPARLSEGEWIVGLVVGKGADDDQAQSIERIITGANGGPFATFSGMVGEYLGKDMAPVELILGNRISASVGGRTNVRFEPSMNDDGTPVEGRNAMYPFTNGFRIGKGTGRSMAFGVGFEANHGELATFAFTDETLAMEAGFGPPTYR
jgi:hypothetical protein